jgi:hypothetical protein
MFAIGLGGVGMVKSFCSYVPDFDNVSNLAMSIGNDLVEDRVRKRREMVQVLNHDFEKSSHHR